MSTPLRLVFDPTGDLLAAAHDCEADVFLQWYGNTRAQLAAEYGPYEQDSVFVAIADQHDDVVACMRLITGATRNVKTIDDVERPPWGMDAPRSITAAGLDPARVWDVATMGVRPGLRQGRTQLSLALYHGFVTTMRANTVQGIVAILDERVRRLMDSVGLRTTSLPGGHAASYLGSASSSPVYAQTVATLDRQRRDFPDAHRLITMGVGLDGVHVPPREHFRLGAWAPARVPAQRVGSRAGADDPARRTAEASAQVAAKV